MTPYSVFSADQGWGNGPVATQDTAGALRMALALKGLTARGRVTACAGITPAFAFTQPARTEAILDVFAGAGVPFWLSVIDSDVLTMMRPASFAARMALGCACDTSHGIGVTVDQLQAWGTRYGSMFAGCRAHEQFSQSRTNACWRNGTLAWAQEFAPYLPGDSFFSLKRTEAFVAFCHATGRPFIWSEPLWSRSEHLWPGTPPPDSGWPDDYGLPKFEIYLRWLVDAYPGTIIPTFANNYPASVSRQFDYWNDLAAAVFNHTGNAGGWGLGDQSWAWSADGSGSAAVDGPVNGWAAHALRYGARVVWVEPSWLMFRGPLYSFGPTGIPPAPDSGTPLPEWNDFCAAITA